MIPAHFNLKQRVTWALTALVALFVILQASMAYLSMAEQEDDLVDDLVLAEAKRLVTYIGQDPDPDFQALSPHFAAWLQAKDGSVSPKPLPAYLAALSVGPHVLKDQPSELHAYVMQTAWGRLYVEYNAEQHEAKVHDFGFYLLSLSALCIALGAVAATQIAMVVVAPLERLSRMLSEWAPGTLKSEEENGNEEAQLLAAFRRVQDRFEEGLANERAFVANARHEIRTPLTALRTDLEMLALLADGSGGSIGGENAGADLRPRLQRAMRTVDEIAGSLDLAHTLSQRHALRAESIELSLCVDAAWASLEGTEGMGQLAFHNQVEGSVTIVADRHALLTILRNLIRNAAEHGSASNCSVVHTARGIEVIDDGVGISPDDLPLVFDRYYRGRRVDAPAQDSASADRGLGLAIARQIADLNGWQLNVESQPQAGTRFILTLTS